MLDLRIVQHPVDCIDRSAGNTVPPEPLNPLISVALCEASLQQRDELVSMSHPAQVVLVSVILGQLRQLQSLTERLPVLVDENGNHDVDVLCLEGLIGHDALVSAAAWTGHFTVRQ